jgi:hypothetical protein
MRFQSRDLVTSVLAMGGKPPGAANGPVPDCRACTATPARPDDPPGCPPPTRKQPPGPQIGRPCEGATAKPKKRAGSLDALRHQLRHQLRAGLRASG